MTKARRTPQVSKSEQVGTEGVDQAKMWLGKDSTQENPDAAKANLDMALMVLVSTNERLTQLEGKHADPETDT